MRLGAVPTRRTWLLVGLGVPLALVGLAIPGFERLVFGWNGLLLLAYWLDARLAPTPRDLEVTRRVPPIFSVRLEETIRLRIRALHRRVRLLIRDIPPQRAPAGGHEFDLTLEPKEERELDYTVQAQQRGPDYFEGPYVRIVGSWGLAQVDYRLSLDAPIRVYPNVRQLREFALLRQRGRLAQMGIRRSRNRGLGTEFESLRDYNEDDFRHIDWKSTARRGRLTVREYEQERNQAVIVCLDVGRAMLSEVEGVSKLDYALDATLMLLHAAVDAGDQVGLAVYAEKIRRYVPPGKGKSQVSMLIEAAHRLIAEPVASDPHQCVAYVSRRWKRRSLFVVFSDADSTDQAKALAGAFGSLRRHHLVLIVRVADERLRRMAQETSELDRRSLYDRAAALMVNSERVKAQAILRGAGLRTLEAEPDELPLALVNAYLQVKESSLL